MNRDEHRARALNLLARADGERVVAPGVPGSGTSGTSVQMALVHAVLALSTPDEAAAPAEHGRFTWVELWPVGRWAARCGCGEYLDVTRDISPVLTSTAADLLAEAALQAHRTRCAP